MRYGTIVFDNESNRYDILFDTGEHYGGLHCGECLEVFVNNEWKHTRIEYGESWYLVGIDGLDGLQARI